MKNLKHITTFTFNIAKYEIADASQNRALLIIDYKNNKYNIKPASSKLSSELITETENIAKDLLLRKHGVNFANI